MLETEAVITQRQAHLSLTPAQEPCTGVRFKCWKPNQLLHNVKRIWVWPLLKNHAPGSDSNAGNRTNYYTASSAF